MSTLSKRATERQRRMMRVVEGAVRNAAHAHPEWRIPAPFAGSVAKRAAGTLAAVWPSVLAATSPAPSVGSEGQIGNHPAASGLDRMEGRMPRASNTGRGAPKYGSGRAPIRRLRFLICRMTGDAKRADETQRAAVLIEVLRLIAKEFPP